LALLKGSQSLKVPFQHLQNIFFQGDHQGTSDKHKELLSQTIATHQVLYHWVHESISIANSYST